MAEVTTLSSTAGTRGSSAAARGSIDSSGGAPSAGRPWERRNSRGRTRVRQLSAMSASARSPAVACRYTRARGGRCPPSSLQRI
ncbi:hypothetical protein GCM10023170_048520 [Phytohabitans houttuyneae]|uniref:Uncharacterized protein n=1 Tax=Phytohabitans houttuyneae TaxID=1076126 RepID=A0A6V8KG30_9ACTN|nr:hypothetical protein Phou_083720 [Phytohabitans houttuyneae]